MRTGVTRSPVEWKTYLKCFIYNPSTLLFCVEGTVSGKENSISSQKLSGKAFFSSQVIQFSSDKRSHMWEASWMGCHCQGISISIEMAKNRKNLCKPVLTPFPTIRLKLKIQGLNFWFLQWCRPGCLQFNHACSIRANETLGYQFPACLTWDDGMVECKDKNDRLFPSGLWFRYSFSSTEVCGSAWGGT